MSNIVKAITATDTGNRRVIQTTSQLFQDVFNIREDMEELTSAHGGVAKVYRIGVSIGNTATVNDYKMLNNDQALEFAIERTKAQVIEAIFGEFRQDFRMIEKLLYNYDFEGAATALRAMEDRMYTDK